MQCPSAQCLSLFFLFADTILFETGFEPPSYSQGALLGQNGWVRSADPFVQQATKFSGLQAVQLNATGLAGQSASRHAISYLATNNPESIVRLSSQVLISSSAVQSRWTIFSLFSPGGFQAQINVHPDGIVGLGTTGPQVGGLPFTFDVWNSLKLTVDLNSQFANAYINGLFIGQKVIAIPGETSLSQIGFGLNSVPGTDTGYFDNIRVVSSVPEPSSSFLGIMGVMIWLGKNRRFRDRRTGINGKDNACDVFGSSSWT